jgi:hypothetical protein
MASPELESSTSSFVTVEGKGIGSIDEMRVKSVEIDLIHYHQQCAGRLVLDPEFVCFSLLGTSC